MKTFFKTMLLNLHYYVRTVLKIKRPIQQVLSVAIENGFYSQSFKPNSSSFMCHALNYAYRAKYITKEELIQTRSTINQYLGMWFTLESYLQEHCLSCDFSARKELYQNWSTRPFK